MRTLTALADHVLSLVVPQLSASGQSCTCFYRYSLCYCKGGLRYSKPCRSYCKPSGCMYEGICGRCIVNGTCP